MSPRYVVREDHAKSRGRWRTIVVVVDTNTDTVRGTFHTRTAAQEWATSMNDSQVEKGGA